MQGEDQSEEDLRLVRKKRAGSMRFYQDNGPRDFPCTACGMLLKNREVVRHPQLDVGICKKCKDFLFSGPFHKVPQTALVNLSSECQNTCTCERKRVQNFPPSSRFSFVIKMELSLNHPGAGTVA